jgi:hypothetical protein
MAVAGGGPTSELLAVSKIGHPPHFSYRDSDPMELLPSGIRNQSGGRSVLGGFFCARVHTFVAALFTPGHHRPV